MGLFDALKEAAASKMEAAKEERQGRQRKAAEEMAWREREPEISLEALNVPVPMDAYDFDSIPTVVNDSMTARKGTQYASGKNFETISRELKEVVAEFGKTGRIIEMDITASFEKGEVMKFVDVHVEPKGKKGYKVEFVVTD